MGMFDKRLGVDLGTINVLIYENEQIVLQEPALVALTIFSFQGQWNNFMDALIIVGTKTELYNLPMGLTILRGSGQDLQFDLILAGAVITTLPMAVIFFTFQRYFVEGVSYSGLKG